ncbi:hypothetical protein D3C81_1087970 [compost metagenome]
MSDSTDPLSGVFDSLVLLVKLFDKVHSGLLALGQQFQVCGGIGVRRCARTIDQLIDPCVVLIQAFHGEGDPVVLTVKDSRGASTLVSVDQGALVAMA